MNSTERTMIMQRWTTTQHELIPQLREEVGAVTPKLEKLIHIIEWVRIEEFVESSWNGIGRPPHDRGMLANAFVAKSVLGLTTTAALIERLQIDRTLRRICGFPMWKRLPAPSCFSRVFAEFATAQLAERVHEAFIKRHLGEQLIGHISRDGTAIEARERPKKVEDVKPVKRFKRGRPRRGEVREAKVNQIEQQLTQPLADIIAALPTACDRGVKCNAQGYKNSWNGYKLHLDTADCGIPISALLTSASVHDSQTAVPLSMMTRGRVTHLYDLMDAAYCSEELRAYSRRCGQVPLIDHNPRRGEKQHFSPHEAKRYQERTQAERTNGRLKDDFGGRHIRVKGHLKVMSHIMFGVLALSAEHWMRL
ncbi:MAG: transposase, partial [Pseudomonadales bacterium]|nr:transposase [Pseudomonadales bacterium]